MFSETRIRSGADLPYNREPTGLTLIEWQNKCHT